MSHERRLSPESRALLLAIAERHAEAITAPTPAAAWERAVVEDVAVYGPLLSISEWFGCQPDGRIYRRYRRALARLIDDGFLETSRADGSKRSNVKLTTDGQALADSFSRKD